MLKIYIEQVEVTEIPKGWDSLTTTTRLDKELKGLFSLLDVTLTFYADGCTIIKTAFETHGYCHQLSFEIRKYDDTATAYLSIYTGILFLKDVEFSEGIENEGYAGSAKCQIQDNSFFAKIRNNRNLKAKIYVGKSKNNETITACPYHVLQMFRPSDGIYYPVISGAGHERNHTAFRVYDVLKYFVDYMSDGTMDFYSDTFDTGGKHEKYLITNGYTLRFTIPGGVTQDLFEENWEEIPFADVFTELDKEFNIGFVAGFDGARAYLRIEEWDYLFPNVVIENLTDVDKITRKAANEYLYDKLIVGSEVVTNEPTILSGPADIRFIWFKREEYVIAGKCNTDRSLDLVNKWIVDSNTIEDMVVYGTSTAPTTFDQSIFLIQSTYFPGIPLWQADQSNWITGAATPVFYNELLNTANKTRRYLGAIPNDIAIQLGVIDNTFNAVSAATFETLSGITFNPLTFTETSDPGNNFATNAYTAPASGIYAFLASVSFKMYDIYGNVPVGSPGCRSDIYAWLDVYASGDVPGVDAPIYSIQIINETSVYRQCGVVFNLQPTAGLNLVMGEVVAVRLNYKGYDDLTLHVGNSVKLEPGAHFRCTATADGGGVYATYDPEDYPIIRSNLTKYPFSASRHKALIADPRGLLSFGTATGNVYYGNIEELKYNHYKEEADFTILSTEAINQ